jgi:hypothetical protein
VRINFSAWLVFFLKNRILDVNLIESIKKIEFANRLKKNTLVILPILIESCNCCKKVSRTDCGRPSRTAASQSVQSVRSTIISEGGAMAADEHTQEYADVMDEAIDSAARAEVERDAAKAEVARLKRQYEPDSGILLSKMLRLEDDNSTSFMRVTVHTGGYLLLELVPRARHLPHYPSWQFYPSLEGKRDNMQDFADYGAYDIAIGDGSCHDLLVNFSKPATVDITVVTTHDGNYDEGPDEMTIKDITTPPAVTLAMTDRTA